MNSLSLPLGIQTQSTATQQLGAGVAPAGPADARVTSSVSQLAPQTKVATPATESGGFGSSRLVNQLFALMGFGGQPTVIISPPQHNGSRAHVVLGEDPSKETQKPDAKAPPVSLVPTRAQIFKATGSMQWQPKGQDGSAEMFFRPEHKGKIAKVELLSEDGTRVIARPTAAGVDSKGRPVYRFKKAGDDFPKGAILMMTMTGGGVRYVEIPNPAKSFKH